MSLTLHDMILFFGPLPSLNTIVLGLEVIHFLVQMMLLFFLTLFSFVHMRRQFAGNFACACFFGNG